MKRCVAGLSVVVVLFAGPHAVASIALDIDLGSVGHVYYAPGNLGWEFTLNSDVTVTQLGFYDKDQDGLVQAHMVGIWDTSENLLISGTVPGGTSAPLLNGFRYQAITPATLASGGTYIIGATQQLAPPTPDAWIAKATTFSQEPAVNYEAARYIQGDGLGDSLHFPVNRYVWPGSGDTAVYMIGPNFQLGEGPVIPEPSTLIIWSVLGAIGTGLGWWRRRKAAFVSLNFERGKM